MAGRARTHRSWLPHFLISYLRNIYLIDKECCQEETSGDINISLWSPGAMTEEEFRIKPCSFEYANRLWNVFIPLRELLKGFLVLEFCYVISSQAFICCSLKKKSFVFFFFRENEFSFKRKF